MARLAETLVPLLDDDEDRGLERAQQCIAGVPERLAQRSAAWPLMHTMFDVVEQAQRKQRPAVDVARSYWQVFDAVDVGWLWDAIGQLPRADRWQTQARSALRDDLLAALAELNDDVVDCGGIVAWRESNERVLARTSAMFSEIRRAAVTDVATLSVALRQVRNLVLTTVAG